MIDSVVLLRHGEAEPSSAQGDFGRQLTDRGSWFMGQHVRRIIAACDLDRHPDVQLWVSPAARTQETAAHLLEEIPSCDLRVMPELYDQNYEEIIDALALEHQVKNSGTCVILVCHSPFVDTLAHDLGAREVFLPGSAAYFRVIPPSAARSFAAMSALEKAGSDPLTELGELSGQEEPRIVPFHACRTELVAYLSGFIPREAAALQTFTEIYHGSREDSRKAVAELECALSQHLNNEPSGTIVAVAQAARAARDAYLKLEACAYVVDQLNHQSNFDEIYTASEHAQAIDRILAYARLHELLGELLQVGELNYGQTILLREHLEADMHTIQQLLGDVAAFPEERVSTRIATDLADASISPEKLLSEEARSRALRFHSELIFGMQLLRPNLPVKLCALADRCFDAIDKLMFGCDLTDEEKCFDSTRKVSKYAQVMCILEEVFYRFYTLQDRRREQAPDACHIATLDADQLAKDLQELSEAQYLLQLSAELVQDPEYARFNLELECAHRDTQELLAALYAGYGSDLRDDLDDHESA